MIDVHRLPHLLLTFALPHRQLYFHFTAEKNEIQRGSAPCSRPQVKETLPARLVINLRTRGVVSGLATWCHSLQTVGRLPGRDALSTGDSGQSCLQTDPEEGKGTVSCPSRGCAEFLPVTFSHRAWNKNWVSLCVHTELSARRHQLTQAS